MAAIADTWAEEGFFSKGGREEGANLWFSKGALQCWIFSCTALLMRFSQLSSKTSSSYFHFPQSLIGSNLFRHSCTDTVIQYSEIVIKTQKYIYSSIEKSCWYRTQNMHHNLESVSAPIIGCEATRVINKLGLSWGSTRLRQSAQS